MRTQKMHQGEVQSLLGALRSARDGLEDLRMRIGPNDRGFHRIRYDDVEQMLWKIDDEIRSMVRTDA